MPQEFFGAPDIDLPVFWTVLFAEVIKSRQMDHRSDFTPIPIPDTFHGCIYGLLVRDIEVYTFRLKGRVGGTHAVQPNNAVFGGKSLNERKPDQPAASGDHYNFFILVPITCFLVFNYFVH